MLNVQINIFISSGVIVCKVKTHTHKRSPSGVEEFTGHVTFNFRIIIQIFIVCALFTLIGME